MILGEIGEHTHGEVHAIHTILRESVGGDLHHHMAAAGIRHAAEQTLHLKALGGGALGRDHFIADHVLIGADKTHLGTEILLQHTLEQVGRGGLAVGTGDCHKGHFLRRMTEPVQTQHRETTAGVFHLHIGDLPLGDLFTQDCCRALLRRHGDEAVTVHRITGDCHKQIAHRRAAGVITDAGDLHIHVRRGRQHRDALQQFLQFHRNPPFRRAGQHK